MSNRMHDRASRAEYIAYLELERIRSERMHEMEIRPSLEIPREILRDIDRSDDRVPIYDSETWR